MKENLSRDVALNVSIAHAVHVDSATGTAVALEDHHGATIVVYVDDWDIGTYTFKAQYSDAAGDSAPSAGDSSWTDAAAADLDGSFSSITSSATDGTFQIVGFTRPARFLRVHLTESSANVSGLDAAAFIMRGPPRVLNAMS